MNKTREERILECLAAQRAGLTTRQITQTLGDEDGKGYARNSTRLQDMIGRELVTRSAKGKPCLITAAGRLMLERRQAGFCPRQGRHRKDDTLTDAPELSDGPVVLRTKAVDGQAPKGIPNSPFNWAQSADPLFALHGGTSV